MARDTSLCVSIWQELLRYSLDPSQAVAYRILGEIYAEQGQYEAANKEFLLAEGIFKNLYKENFENMHEVKLLKESMGKLTDIAQ